jgi:hypothetical protein
MPLLTTIVIDALATAILLMAMVWVMWPSWQPGLRKAVKGSGGAALHLRRRNSPKPSLSRP